MFRSSRLFCLASCFFLCFSVFVALLTVNIYADDSEGLVCESVGDSDYVSVASDSDDYGVAVASSKTEVTLSDFTGGLGFYSSVSYGWGSDWLLSYQDSLYTIYDVTFDSGRSYYLFDYCYATYDSGYYYYAYFFVDDNLLANAGDSFIFSFPSYSVGFVFSDNRYASTDYSALSGYFDSTGYITVTCAVTDGYSWTIGSATSYTGASFTYCFDDLESDVYGYAVCIKITCSDYFTDYSYVTCGLRKDSFSVYSDDSTKGLLSTIIEWLSSIFDNISDGFSNLVSSLSSMLSSIGSWFSSIFDYFSDLISDLGSWFSDLFSALAALPSEIWNLIKEGLQDLFIPDDDYISDFQSDLKDLLSDRLGVIYDGFVLFSEFVGSISDVLSSGGDYSYSFPGISITLAGEDYTIIESQDISLDNDVMDILRPVAGTLVILVVTLAFVLMLRNMYERFVSS